MRAVYNPRKQRASPSISSDQGSQPLMHNYYGLAPPVATEFLENDTEGPALKRVCPQDSEIGSSPGSKTSSRTLSEDASTSPEERRRWISRYDSLQETRQRAIEADLQAQLLKVNERSSMPFRVYTQHSVPTPTRSDGAVSTAQEVLFAATIDIRRTYTSICEDMKGQYRRRFRYIHEEHRECRLHCRLALSRMDGDARNWVLVLTRLSLAILKHPVGWRPATMMVARMSCEVCSKDET